jgi:diadenosine tetraphosphate (Ap4A) HIT family hydrolase
VSAERTPGCVFCESAGGDVLREDERCRVVWAYQPDHPGFCRVIWDAHVKEMTELGPPQREHLMRVVFATEHALIATVAPDKVNLASLGNQVPHVHWHVIPRFRDDPHFPNPVWGEKQRNTTRPLPPDFAMRMRKALDDLLRHPR